LNNSILFMIAMVALLPVLFGGLVWHAYRKQADKPAYEPTDKIRWSSSSEET